MPEELSVPEPARRNTLPRAHRLKRQRLIRPLFDRRRPDVGVLRVGSVVLRYRLATEEEVGEAVPLQVGFAVGRRVGSNARRARIKRVLREVYRVHQHDLVGLFSRRPEVLTAMVLYSGGRDGAEGAIGAALPVALARLASRFAEGTLEGGTDG